MPNEIRILDFSCNEVALALRQHGQQIKITFPQARITSIKLDRLDEDTIILQLKSLTDARAFDFPLTMTQMAACLISYCIAQNIPIPRHGHKTIARSKSGLALQIVLPDVHKQPAASARAD